MYGACGGLEWTQTRFVRGVGIGGLVCLVATITGVIAGGTLLIGRPTAMRCGRQLRGGGGAATLLRVPRFHRNPKRPVDGGPHSLEKFATVAGLQDLGLAVSWGVPCRGHRELFSFFRVDAIKLLEEPSACGRSINKRTTSTRGRLPS